MKTTELIYPELLTVPAQVAEIVATPALARLLSLAKAADDTDICSEQTVLRLLGYVPPRATALPVARARWQNDFGETAPDFCVCADPVHMLADTDHARMMDERSLQLIDSEADDLLENLNLTFAEDEYSFVRGESGCWYLTGKDATLLDTLPTKILVGRNVASFLPEGDQTADWRRLMTEIQMLLHVHPVNQHRMTRGQLTVNALWLWGGGELPERQTKSSPLLYTDDSFARGLSQMAACQFHPAYEFSQATFSAEYTVLFDSEALNLLVYEDYESWQDWIKKTDKTVFEPVLKKFIAGDIDRVIINAGNRRQFMVEKSIIRRLFSSTKSLKAFVDPKFAEPLEP